MIITGLQLIETINATKLSVNECALWWLGQHSFILKKDETVIYIDPFLSDHGKRLIPSLLDANIIDHADFIIGTHNHRDHIDKESWPTLATSSPNATFICPEYHHAELLEELSLASERLKGINAGESIDLPSMRINAIASAHESLDKDDATGLYPFLGFVYELDDLTLYHPGDCCIYNGLLTTLSEFDIDIALLPINCRDAERLARNCIGNMTYQEAADLAGALGVKTVIPAHFDMFPGNREDPGLFCQYVNVKYPDIEAKIPRYGEKMLFKA